MTPLVRWVVPEGTRETLGALVTRFGPAAAGAIAQGRVFVAGRRAERAEHELAAGDVVELYAERAHPVEVSVLAEHGGLVFAYKPPGAATEPDHAGAAGSVVARVAEQLGLARGALHALSRLDVGVSGVVTLARDAAARELVAAARGEGRFVRRYVAVASRAPEPSAGAWTWSLGRDEHRGKRARSQPRVGGATLASGASREAETLYAVAGTAGSVHLPQRGAAAVASSPALLALAPVTGRTHQLRLHAARAGVPLLGDGMHGGPERFVTPNGSVRGCDRVALHAAWVELRTNAGSLHVAAPVPEDLTALWRELGGDAAAWDHALEIALTRTRG